MHFTVITSLFAVFSVSTAALIPFLGGSDISLLSLNYEDITDQENSNIPGGSPIVICDSEVDQLIEVQSVVLEPNPPIPGQNLTITAEALLNTDITAGSYVDVVVRYGFIVLINKRYDLCEVLPEADLECPIRSGPMKITRTFEIPSGIPPGEYIVSAGAYTLDDELLTCLYADVFM